MRTLKVDVLKNPKIYYLQVCPGIFQPINVTGWGCEGVNNQSMQIALPDLLSGTHILCWLPLCLSFSCTLPKHMKELETMLFFLRIVKNCPHFQNRFHLLQQANSYGTKTWRKWKCKKKKKSLTCLERKLPIPLCPNCQSTAASSGNSSFFLFYLTVSFPPLFFLNP